MFSNSENVEYLICKYNVCVLVIELEFIVFEKMGYEYEIIVFFYELEKIGIYEFVCFGCVVIVKFMEWLNWYL